jgi:membrane protease YdiL (CAAX protease family)
MIAGLSVASAGTLPWAALVAANMKHLPSVPWAVPVTALYLWFFCRYVRGEGWPRSTAASRRASSRANAVPGDLWGLALFAGMLGLISVLLLQGVMSRLVTLPQQRDLDVSQFPVWSVVLWVLMSAVVAGVVEETAFRGYVQRPIERRHGPVIGILVNGALFGLIHFSHPEVPLVLMPYYMAVAGVYGALAYVTDSTLPSMVLHGGGNVWSAVGLFTQGRSEWTLAPAPPPLVWQTGPDLAFVANIAALLVMGAATVWAFAEVSRTARLPRA